MHDRPIPTELDYRMLNALQIQPRAPWALLASVLDTDPATIARRWERLSRSGTAWVTCEPPLEPATAVALVEVDCQPGAVIAIATQLAKDPEAISIDITAGARDLVVTVAASTQDALNRYILDRLNFLPHVHRVRSHLNITSYTRASQWRLRALDRAQAARLSMRPRTTDQSRLDGVLDNCDWDIVTALNADGRATTTDLAVAVGVSTSTAHRRLHRLLAQRGVQLRCDLARTISGWTTSTWLFLSCPAASRAGTGRALAKIPEVRATFSTAGPYNLVLSLWLRSLSDLESLETQLTTKAPHIDIVDRAVVMRPIKLLGRILDPAGYAAGVVPCDLRPQRHITNASRI
jgi:DNA-binding Lrp family transcriptional regulator